VLGFAAGIGLGLGLAFTLTRMLRRARAELPGVLADEAREAVATVGGRLRSAVEEGVRAMRATEAELRDRVLDGNA
jgi:hypothetical protein